jgi:hypothetical protein
MLIFGLPGYKLQIRPRVKKSPSKEGILCTTGFYKLPGLPQKSQIKQILNQQAVNVTTMECGNNFHCANLDRGTDLPQQKYLDPKNSGTNFDMVS